MVASEEDFSVFMLFSSAPCLEADFDDLKSQAAQDKIIVKMQGSNLTIMIGNNLKSMFEGNLRHPF
jgi:hypothetical protein